jgi:UDP-4-amino-4,6-dideoxy-N-acetyl-beta-L-altrosamine transaminase
MNAIPYGRQTITEEDILAVKEALQSDFLTQGPRIEEFERAFATYVGASYAVANANGTTALHLACLALGLAPGDRVIVSPNTFAASANCVKYCGGDVTFADIDPLTFALDPKAVRRLLESNPKGTFKGVIPVDFAGLPADWPAFRELADEFGLWLLEDSCHAPGASFFDKKGQLRKCGDGSHSDFSIFSFHPVKHIACGEGGMLTTNNKQLADKARILRTHGITRDSALLKENHGPWYYEMQELGYNFRLTDFQAALGLSQLKRADAGLKRRRLIARKYDEAFNGKLETQFVPKGFFHAYHLYVILTQNRRELFDALRAKQIFAQVHYIPVHMMPYYKQLGWKEGDLPNVEQYYRHCVSLPMFPSLSDQEQEYVIDCVLEHLK